MLTGPLLTALFWVLAMITVLLAVRVRHKSRLMALTLCCLALASSLNAVSRAVRTRHEHLFILSDRLDAGATIALILACIVTLLMIMHKRNKPRL